MLLFQSDVETCFDYMILSGQLTHSIFMALSLTTTHSQSVILFAAMIHSDTSFQSIVMTRLLTMLQSLITTHFDLMSLSLYEVRSNCHDSIVSQGKSNSILRGTVQTGMHFVPISDIA